MGWKSLKDHYRIGHAVQVTKAGIAIGSAYIHDIIVVAPTGKIVKRYDPGRGWSRNDELDRYQSEIDADPALARRLIEQPDTFERSIPVYTYDGADIIECFCEELGWPNVTHDGRMMYDNTFSADRAEVVSWALRSAEAGIENWTEIVAERERNRSEAVEQLAIHHRNRAVLLELANQDHPTC